jgi:ABC-type transport system substrate-binding protein
VKLITAEAWKLEATFLAKMLERVGVKTEREVLSMPALFRRVYAPLLEKPAEEQDWDLSMWYWFDLYGHTGATFLTFGFLDGSDVRWIEYDSIYERMWNEMAMTLDTTIQEDKIRQMVERIYEDSYAVFLYSPMTLYAVNKAVNLVPHALGYYRLKDTSVTNAHWSVRKQVRK